MKCFSPGEAQGTPVVTGRWSQVLRAWALELDVSGLLVCPPPHTCGSRGSVSSAAERGQQ